MPGFVRWIGYSLAKVYWHARRPVALGSRAIVVKGGRVLLVRLTYAKGWYLPGGGVNRGESFREAVIRELREECGIEVEHPRLQGLYFTRRYGRIDHVAIFVIESFREIESAAKDPEIAEIGYFDPLELPTDTTPATSQRIKEYLGHSPVIPEWSPLDIGGRSCSKSRDL